MKSIPLYGIIMTCNESVVKGLWMLATGGNSFVLWDFIATVGVMEWYKLLKTTSYWAL